MSQINIIYVNVTRRVEEEKKKKKKKKRKKIAAKIGSPKG